MEVQNIRVGKRNLPSRAKDSMVPQEGALRRVSFSTEVEIHHVNRRCDLSDEEHNSTWYCKADLKCMKKIYVPTLKKIAKGIPLGDGDEEPRGLEHKTPKGHKRRHRNRFASLDAVFQEQDRQWERNYFDADYIAKIYIQSSAHCSAEARSLAREDAEYVEKNIRCPEDDGGLLQNDMAPVDLCVNLDSEETDDSISLTDHMNQPHIISVAA